MSVFERNSPSSEPLDEKTADAIIHLDGAEAFLAQKGLALENLTDHIIALQDGKRAINEGVAVIDHQNKKIGVWFLPWRKQWAVWGIHREYGSGEIIGPGLVGCANFEEALREAQTGKK